MIALFWLPDPMPRQPSHYGHNPDGTRREPSQGYPQCCEVDDQDGSMFIGWRARRKAELLARSDASRAATAQAIAAATPAPRARARRRRR